MFLAHPLADQPSSEADWSLKAAECVRLTDLEELAIALGGTDPLASIQPPPRWPWLANWLTGAAPVNKLANDRLEALRNLVVGLRFPSRISSQRAVFDALEAGIGLELVSTLCLRFGQASREKSHERG